MKLLHYLKVRKNRDLLILINVVLAVGLALLSVAIDEKYGATGLSTIYLFQVICIINLVISIPLIIWNVATAAKQKIAKQDEKRNRL